MESLVMSAALSGPWGALGTSENVKKTSFIKLLLIIPKQVLLLLDIASFN